MHRCSVILCISRSSKIYFAYRAYGTIELRKNGQGSERAGESNFKSIESKVNRGIDKLDIDLSCFAQVLGVWSTSYIPKGTRFGPLVGHVYTKDSVPADANRKYFWRVRIVGAPLFKNHAAGISQAVGYHRRQVSLDETDWKGEGKKTRGRRKGKEKDRERSLQRPETGFSRSSEP